MTLRLSVVSPSNGGLKTVRGTGASTVTLTGLSVATREAWTTPSAPMILHPHVAQIRCPMAFDPEYLTLMTQTIAVQPYTSVDIYGKKVYSGSASTYFAYISEQPTKVINYLGAEVIASHIAYIASTSRLDITSKYTFPDGSTPHPIRASVMYDEDGIHHNFVAFGAASG